MNCPAERVAGFYNQRRTAEQHIKEDKSCRKFGVPPACKRTPVISATFAKGHW